MADHHHRVHPVREPDSPARPITSPLVPPGSAVSEKGNPLNAAAHRRWNHGLVPTEPSKSWRRSSCCRCLCWTFCLLFLLIIAIGIAAGVLYLIFQPKLPKYSINSLRILSLRLNTDMTLYARFRVNITAENPNEKIGIYYKHGGQLSVWYNSEKLCSGSLPRFYQGHDNVTQLKVDMMGRTKSGNTLMAALQEQQNTGRIPLDLKVQAPVAIKFGRLKTRKVRILGECLLVVDSLSSNYSVSIKASNCGYRLKL
ncbi:hypothetical protein CRG98_016303 [Punica granatum]|uniref:Late embryogenesis abundant protein LEA-2 subgroup domain-containing protein n=2 Tax=Punica granatum TaxID=22663 RepID=A0A2I0K454_PUNGR|nr:hypothetical protein CRG98_016303 [Punica granatum]